MPLTSPLPCNDDNKDEGRGDDDEDDESVDGPKSRPSNPSDGMIG